jgi:hypothetical protein
MTNLKSIFKQINKSKVYNRKKKQSIVLPLPKETITYTQKTKPYIIQTRHFLNWLYQKVNDRCITSKYSINDYQILPDETSYDFESFNYYYNLDETNYELNLKKYLLNNKNLSNEDRVLSKYIEKYDDLTVFIPPNTNYYHVNHLFKQIINVVDEFDMYYNISNDEVRPIFDINLKKLFFEFCHKYSH